MTAEQQGVGSLSGANSIPLDADGRAYHFGCRAGEVSNAVLLLADYVLAEEISKTFDKLEFKRVSNRGYTTYTGTYKGARLSIIAVGIGFCMMDFLLHELRRVVTGPLTFIQIGTAPSPINLPLGTAVVVRDAVAYVPDYENFESPSPYKIYATPVKSANPVVAAVEAGLRVLQIPYEFGRVASSPSFIGSISAHSDKTGLDLKTDGLLERVTAQCGPIASLEMDTYPLLWMSLRATGDAIWSGAVSVVGSNLKGEVWPEEQIKERVVAIGAVMLAQLAALQSAR